MYVIVIQVNYVIVVIFLFFLNYLKRNNIQYIYAEKVLYFPVESEIADILRVYNNNWNAVYDSIVDCHLAEKESK